MKVYALLAVLATAALVAIALLVASVKYRQQDDSGQAVPAPAAALAGESRDAGGGVSRPVRA